MPTYTGNNGDDYIVGSENNDTIFGRRGNDTLIGGDGDDIIFGGEGHDTLYGGDGDDVFTNEYADYNDNDSYLGGAGTDTLKLEIPYQFTSLILDVASSVEVIDFNGNKLYGNGLDNIIDLSGVARLINRDDIHLGNGDDTFRGSVHGEVVFGGYGNDTLYGGGGDDTLYGDNGTDSLDGGDGDDLFIAETGKSIDLYQGGAGTDTLQIKTRGSYTGIKLDIAASVEVLDFNGATYNADELDNTIDLSGITKMINGGEIDLGDGADTFLGSMVGEIISGGEGNDTIYGGGGNDTIYGGDGVDDIYGGEGDDIFVIRDSSTDNYQGDAGTDTVQLSVYSLSELTLDAATSVEVFDFGGKDLRGDSLSNTIDLSGVISMINVRDIRLSGGADTFRGSIIGEDVYGEDGRDSLYGGGGNDTLYGGSDNDLLKGGTGGDVLNGGSADDKLFGNAGDDFLNGGDEWDQLFGGNGHDILNGDAGNDTLRGNRGNDTLNGGTGDDLLIGGKGGDVFVFIGSFGQDTIIKFAGRNKKEKIDLSEVSSIERFSDLEADHMSQVGKDVVIDDLAGNTITITNIKLALLDETDFLF